MTAKELLKALEIFTKDGSDGDLSAEHDELFVGGAAPKDLNAEDREELKKLGWRWNTRFDCWEHFT